MNVTEFGRNQFSLGNLFQMLVCLLLLQPNACSIAAKLNDLHCIFGFCFYFYLFCFVFILNVFLDVICIDNAFKCTMNQFYHNVKSIEMRLFDVSDVGTMVLLILSSSSGYM